MADSPLIIGLGNELRGDDGVGLRVAELLIARGVDAIRLDGEPIALLELWREADAAVIVDAVSGPRAGRIWRIESSGEELPLVFAEHPSTHLLGLAEVIELARSLQLLPARLTVIGIEGDRFDLGETPSAAVSAAATDVTAALLAEARGCSPAHPGPTEPVGVGR